MRVTILPPCARNCQADGKTLRSEIKERSATIKKKGAPGISDGLT